MKRIDSLIETLLTKKYYTIIDAFFLAMMFSVKGVCNLIVFVLWIVYRKYYVPKVLGLINDYGKH